MLVVEYPHMAVSEVLKHWMGKCVEHFPVSIRGHGNGTITHHGYILGIEMEDGSGYNWLIRMNPKGQADSMIVFVQFPRTMRLVPKGS